MTWKNLNLKEQRRIVDKHRSGEPLDNVAEFLNVKLDTLTRYITRFIYHETQILKEKQQSITIPPSPSRAYLDYETVETNDCLIISDLEIPDHDEKFLRAALLLAMRHGIKDLIVAGDLIATDQPGLSSHEQMLPPAAQSYHGALELAKSMLWQGFGGWMERIIAIEGNHDDMLSRKTGGEIHVGMFIENAKTRYSRYSYLYLKTERDYTFVCHPRQFRRNSGSLGQDFYNVNTAPDGSKPNIVIAHTHLPQFVQSPDARHWICALGTMRDPLRTAYKALRAGTYHQWGSQFLMIKNGYPYPMHRLFTDWHYWLGDLYEPELFNSSE